ncbi:hypothetical protein HanOQP8_Chr05g0199511 [Helianthus annuus]|nr:hypothetical protein HanOQP8_Chr05g0199511 [Helianthus annuus]
MMNVAPPPPVTSNFWGGGGLVFLVFGMLFSLFFMAVIYSGLIRHHLSKSDASRSISNTYPSYLNSMFLQHIRIQRRT